MSARRLGRLSALGIAALLRFKRLIPQRLRIARVRLKAALILFDWTDPLAEGWNGESWSDLRERAQNDPDAPRVLMATTVSGHLAAVQFDALLAVALTMRGVKVCFLVCDAALPACMVDQHDWYDDRAKFLREGGQRDACKTCLPVGEAYLAPLGLPVVRLSSLVTAEERREAHAAADAVDLPHVRDWQVLGLPVGEHGLAGALRFHARADLAGEPFADAVLRQYLRAGSISAFAARALLKTFSYDVLVAHHAIYIPQGVWAAAARQAGRRVVAWNPGYKTNSFILSQQDTYHKTMISERPALWEDLELDAMRRRKLFGYLDQRRSGAGDWISFGSGQAGRFPEYLETLGLDPGKPTIGLLTSVMWDAQLHYESNAFESQLAWLDATIEHFSSRTDVNLIIRIHPAEIVGFIATRQPLAAHIESRYGRLPPHIAVVRPDNPLNTYGLMDGCDSVLVYSTKTGIELSAVGTPVVVAGEAWIRRKGFSIDASDPAQYESILRTLPLGRRLTPVQSKRAERYAWHFFFRRMVELPGFEKRSGWPPYRVAIANLDAIAPGANANLDMVCREIVAGGPFLAVDGS